MLNKYLSAPPTIMERPAVEPGTERVTATQICNDKRSEMRAFLDDWQLLWDQSSRKDSRE